ncbi:unnamed protein product [Hydatigera taeniaeformis]|uniref:Uncharacterized protein n=1 Tax=Hydatigena taeniaeformis TaxID=6205 RepID=A0A0R3XAZ0_HYDTA|nr:unnamed protein product [Hydatigera taeniaeformis]
MTRNSESPESPESPLPRDRPSMQLLTLPPSGRNYSRNCSIASYRSEDALSNLSLGSLLPPDLDDEILCIHLGMLIDFAIFCGQDFLWICFKVGRTLSSAP